MDAAPRDRGVNLAPLLGSSSAEMITDLGGPMGKTGRKRRARKKKGANHGKRPNA